VHQPRVEVERARSLAAHFGDQFFLVVQLFRGPVGRESEPPGAELLRVHGAADLIYTHVHVDSLVVRDVERNQTADFGSA